MHFVIASFVARWSSGEPRLSDEVDRVEWVESRRPLPSPTTPELSEILARAARIEAERALRRAFRLLMEQTKTAPAPTAGGR